MQPGKKTIVAPEPKRQSAEHAERIARFSDRLSESGRFHMGQGNVRQTIQELAADFENAQIDYAILGAMALNAHGYARETTDVDVLVTPEGLNRFHETLVGRGYIEAFTNARKTFRNTRTATKVEFITTGEYPGDGKPKPVVFPRPEDVAVTIAGARYVDLPVLVELKLASGMTQPARRRDLADIQDLIRTLKLDAAFAERLNEFVRPTYLMLLRELEFPDPYREQ